MAVDTTTNYGYKKPDYTEDGDVLLINENMDEIDGDIHNLSTGKKNVQTAVSSPSANGTELAFIDTISQNTQGVISATKKTVKDMVGAGSSNGAHGLVPQPLAADKDKFLKGNGTWAVPTDTDTKNTAGSTDTSSKIFLIGATSQAANPQTYSHDTAYVGTDGCLYSGGVKVLTAHQNIAGKKDVQTAVSDPTASGNSLTFIATISQNTNGVISATKKTVTTMGGASGSAAGSAGLVPAPAKGNQVSFLRGDGTWQTPTNTTYSAGTGLSLAGTTFSLPNSGVTAGSYGPIANVSGTNGTTINVPQIAVDAQGRVTSVTNRVYTSVNTDTNTTYSAGTNGGLSLSGTAFSLASSIPGARIFSDTTESTSTTTGAVKISGGLGVAKNIVGNKVYNAVWNDYAECREANETQPGRVVRETVMGVMVKTEKRRMRGCKIISDTFGTCMGETDKAKTPIGVAGRVLAYPARDRRKFYLGAPVCSGPNGTVDVMSRLEAILFPECIIGTVSEIPRYDKWIAGTKKNPKEIEVDGRIWIYVR